MKSGLEDRNNPLRRLRRVRHLQVSMKSGLEDRNNEQMDFFQLGAVSGVSMKSGLEDRNNTTGRGNIAQG